LRAGRIPGSGAQSKLRFCRSMLSAVPMYPWPYLAAGQKAPQPQHKVSLQSSLPQAKWADCVKRVAGHAMASGDLEQVWAAPVTSPVARPCSAGSTRIPPGAAQPPLDVQARTSTVWDERPRHGAAGARMGCTGSRPPAQPEHEARTAGSGEPARPGRVFES
jgi:hypothetical protein